MSKTNKGYSDKKLDERIIKRLRISRQQDITKTVNPFISERQCSTKTPEPHLLGEFPMSCYNCHVYADS